MTTTEVLPGQSWAIRDDRYDGWRYVTVQAIEGDRALVQRRYAGRRSRIQLKSFRRSRFAFCGYDGPGTLPAYEGSVANGCGRCPPKARALPATRELAVGFGVVEVTCDGEGVWSGDDERKTVSDVDAWATDRPGDWRITFIDPMSEETYQRQDGQWVLVWRGFGFA